MISPIKVPVLLGPTATGKTDTAISLCDALGMEVVSCDSRQIYRKLDIGTAKPDLAARKKIHHHLIDIIDPETAYSAWQFASDAGTILGKLNQRGCTGLLCGGTGFYFRALERGIQNMAQADSELRKHYEKIVMQSGPNSIFRELEACNPEAARRIHPNNVQRVIRALEIYRFKGHPAHEHNPPESSRFQYCVIVLTLPRDDLYRRIDRRVDTMWQSGLWEEFYSLINQGYSKKSPGLKTLGYQELFDVYEHRINAHTAVETIKQKTRNFAKRQMTWFRHQLGSDATVIENSPKALSEITDRFKAFLEP